MASTGESHGSGATSSDGRSIAATFGNESNIGDLPLALLAPSSGMNGSGYPPHDLTPSDDYGLQAFAIAEAVTLSLASSMTTPASLSPTLGGGDRRKQSRSPRRDDGSRAFPSGTHTPRSRHSPVHPYHERRCRNI